MARKRLESLSPDQLNVGEVYVIGFTCRIDKKLETLIGEFESMSTIKGSLHLKFTVQGGQSCIAQCMSYCHLSWRTIHFVYRRRKNDVP